MGESAVTTRRFRVAGMSSDRCVVRIEAALKSVPGVESAIADLERDEVLVRADPAVRDETLAVAADAVGYTLVLAPESDPVPEPAPAPEPEPAPEPKIAPDEVETDQPARSWIPSWSTVWFVVSRTAVGLFVFSLFITVVYRFLPVPFTLLMAGEALFEGKSIRQTWVPLERISPNLVRAVIASEDNEFCHHWGFDFKELNDAWRESRNGGRLRGASTISQQTAKNVFLWPGRSYVRKGFEAYFTVLIEALWPKRRIMEVYLNVIEWGPGVFGAEAASRRWFNKSAARLTPLEAARLAAILPNPNRYRANPPGPYVADRGYTIAARANSVDLNRDDRCAKP